MDFNASISQFWGIILISKLYPSSCRHLVWRANKTPTELTKISTLSSNFFSKSHKTHYCHLHRFDTCLSEKLKLLKHRSFQPMFYFPTPSILHTKHMQIPSWVPNRQPVHFLPKLSWANRAALPLLPITHHPKYAIQSGIADLSLSSLEFKIFELL